MSYTNYQVTIAHVATGQPRTATVLSHESDNEKFVLGMQDSFGGRVVQIETDGVVIFKRDKSDEQVS